jgi:ubiquinone/menaquinone biosynthesis C-methylase UbiE
MKAHIERRKNKPQSNLDFKMMSLCFAIRDKFKDPRIKIEKTGIKSGDKALDYGCGPGSYSLAAADVVGPSGKIYAADIHPLAIKKVKKKAKKKGFSNIETILTNCGTGLGEKCLDLIICFDSLHAFENLEQNLIEFHRVLKQNGMLSVDDHHYEENEIISKIEDIGFFKFLYNKDNVLNFINKDSK